MTLAEVERAVKSKNRIIEREAKTKASFDYILAQLIGANMAKVLDSKSQFPTLSEAYPSIFLEEEEEEPEEKADISTLRFIQFAQKHNLKYQEVAKN